MLYPSNYEEKLGFDKIRMWLREKCSSGRGKTLVEDIRFRTRYDDIMAKLAQYSDMMRALEASESLPSLQYIDAVNYLQDARIPGTFLEGTLLRDLSQALHTIAEWNGFLVGKRDIYPHLSALKPDPAFNPQLAADIEWAIDERGEVRDQASPELKKIRAELASLGVHARKTLEKIMQRSRKDGFCPDDGSLTVRSGRLVLPVKAEHKRHLRGFIHDESATGSIAYIEPAEVLEINNEIVELEYREKREIIAVLTRLTDRLRPEIPLLEEYFDLLARVDLIHAVARFSLEIQAIIPSLIQNSLIDWRQARHPILMKSLAAQGKKIVPLDIRLGIDFRILVVSGPNAGGKSVCLKTVGLLQYMLQCGLPIPVAEGSQSGIFENLFIDIGDEQSIENDLSTYSYHLGNMRHFLDLGGPATLLLIDEFGSGTDPLYGGAIAEAILGSLLCSWANGVVTTHYSNLKKMADSTDGLMNGRMGFDVDSLQPLYRLEIGTPGSSFALEIASKIGLSNHLLTIAKRLIGDEQIQLDQLLVRLENEKKTLEERNCRLKEKESILDKTLSEYHELKHSLEQNKVRTLNEARQEARDLIRDANRKIEQVIRTIREQKAEPGQTKQQRESLRELETKLAHIPAESVDPSEETTKALPGKAGVGDKVRIIGQESWGEVISCDDRYALVLFGNLKSKLPFQRLERVSVSEDTSKTARTAFGVVRGIDLTRRKAEFNTNLDLRGKRADEALAALYAFLDNAKMFGAISVRIVHGKGDGILRELVRRQLRELTGIAKIYPEHADRGGEGVTIAEFI